MKKILNDIGIITLISLIGLMIGVTYQHCLVVKDISELEQKINILLDQEGDIVCKVSIIDGYYYYVCDEAITKMPSL